MQPAEQTPPQASAPHATESSTKRHCWSGFQPRLQNRRTRRRALMRIKK